MLKGSLELLLRAMLASWVLGRDELAKEVPMESLFLAMEEVGVLEEVLFCFLRSWISLSILMEICLSCSESSCLFLLMFDSSCPCLAVFSRLLP